MKNGLYIDCHTHSNNSPDGDCSVHDMVQTARDLGLFAYGLSDHCEANDPDPLKCVEMTRKSFLDMQKEKEAFEHKDIKLLAGVELGQALQDEAMAEKILSMCGFDFVIGSLHNLKGFEDFAFLDYHITENAAPVLVGKYFNELLELAQWNKFDVLGHLTYPLRYIQGVMKISLDMSSYEYIIDEILKIVIQNGKGIEINTSGLRQALGLTMPNKAIVKRYKDLGGEIITVGSDAHCTKDLGKGIADAYELLKECGFDHVCYFEQRKPMFIKI